MCDGRKKIILRGLALYETVAAGAALCVATARIAYVDFAERAIVARVVVFAFRNAATDTFIYFVFIYHHEKPSFCRNSMRNFQKIIDNSRNFLYNIEKEYNGGVFRRKEDM